MSVPDKEKLEAILSILEQGNTDRINIRYTHKINVFNSKAIVSLGNEKFVFRSPVPHEEFVEKMKSMQIQDDRIQGIVFEVFRGTYVFYMFYVLLSIAYCALIVIGVYATLFIKVSPGMAASLVGAPLMIWHSYTLYSHVRVEKFDPVQIQPNEVKNLLLLLAENTVRSAT